MPISTAVKLLREGDILRGNFNSTRTCNQTRQAKDPDVDEALSEWFLLITSRGVRVSGPVMKCKAGGRIEFKRVHGKKKTSDDVFAFNDWKVDGLNDLAPDNDEIADDCFIERHLAVLYVSKGRAIRLKKKQWRGLQCLCCMNMTGSDEKNLLVVGKSLKPVL